MSTNVQCTVWNGIKSTRNSVISGGICPSGYEEGDTGEKLNTKQWYKLRCNACTWNMPRTMVWRERLGNRDVDSRQLAVVQGSSSTWMLSELENPENDVWENNNVKLNELDKMVAMECTGCTGNLGNKIRKKMGKWIQYGFPPNLPKSWFSPPPMDSVIILVSEQSAKELAIDSNVYCIDVLNSGVLWLVQVMKPLNVLHIF